MAKKAKPPIQHRQHRGLGGVQRLRQPDGTWKFRARKRKTDRRPALGTVRDSFEEALADRPFLSWDSKGNPIDVREQSSAIVADSQPPSAPLFRDFMLRLLDAERADQLSYSAWQRDEQTFRYRVWNSELGRMPLDQVTQKHCATFLFGDADRGIKAQRKLKPLRDRHGAVRLFEPDERGLPDPDRAIASDRRQSSAIKTWQTSAGPLRLQRDGHWAIEAPKGVPMFVETSERLKASTLRGIGNVLSAYFEAAMQPQYGYIAVNPMHRLKYPKERKAASSRRSLLPEEAANLDVNIFRFKTGLVSQGDRFEAMVLTGRDTGMRRGELCGQLRASVVKTRSGCSIRIDNGRTRIPGGTLDSLPKTGRIREVPITEETYERIMLLPARRCPDTGNVYAFSTATGRPVRPDNFSRSFRKFKAAIGMPSLKLHHLRHTWASLLFRSGADLKTVQFLGGWATPKVLLEIYAETFQDSHRDAIGRFMQLLSEARKISSGAAAADGTTGEIIELAPRP